MLFFLVFLFIINPVYADWPSDCNEFGIDKIIDIDCNEIEPRTIFFFNGTSTSEWIDECSELGLEKVIKIWQNEISPGDSIACLHILELNLTERQLDILDKEIHWHKMIPIIEDNLIDNFSPTLRNCIEFRSDLAVLEGNLVNYDKNRLNVNVPYWGFDLVLKQPCTFDNESTIRGHYDFLQENIIFNENEIAKMKMVLPAIYFEEFLHDSHIDKIHPQTIRTPLQQFKFGIPMDEIRCKEGLELILKTSDGSPACAKPETKQKLIERGWAKHI
jgi:hypothetical protein